MAEVRYLVNDVDAAMKFYVDLLGFTLKRRMGPPFAMVSRGDLTLWLSGPGSSASRPMPDGRQPEPGGWNRLQFLFEGHHREQALASRKLDQQINVAFGRILAASQGAEEADTANIVPAADLDQPIQVKR